MKYVFPPCHWRHLTNQAILSALRLPPTTHRRVRKNCSITFMFWYRTSSSSVKDFFVLMVIILRCLFCFAEASVIYKYFTYACVLFPPDTDTRTMSRKKRALPFIMTPCSTPHIDVAGVLPCPIPNRSSRRVELYDLSETRNTTPFSPWHFL
jgi:hypothetical protein